MIVHGHGLMTEQSGSIPNLYEIKYEPYVVEAVNRFITTHECHVTFELSTGRQIPLPVERRSWKINLGTCQMGHTVTATCLACNTTHEAVSS